MKPKCPCCQSSNFEEVLEYVLNSNEKKCFIICSHCGCVVGVLDLHNAAELIRELADKLNIKLSY